MIGLLQRVTEASVTVEGRVVASIGRGLLVLVAVTREDTEEAVSRLMERILTYRVFPDDCKRMNLCLEELGLDLLLVPQFTLAADTRKGRRASFTGAAEPETGARFFDLMVKLAAERLSRVESGIFGADMQVALVNDGPVTFWLES
ncbi:MAG TPA: D-aminoacyl-tRNA deacylase [Woeseiaceae bacterium]|nr:D-aminoacyl-tRNA deacylase [Woeseiaceae bacterium]